MLNNIDFMEILLIFIGYVLGINFPDIDHKIKFLGHRSWLTHSPVVTYVLYFMAKENNMKEINYILIGFSFAIGIHLMFDLFPKAWTGGSIIKPFGGILFSKVYILTGAILSFVFSLRIIVNNKTYMLVSLIGFIAMLIYSKKEKVFFRPILSYIIIVFGLGSLFLKGFSKELLDIYYGIIKLSNI